MDKNEVVKYIDDILFDRVSDNMNIMQFFPDRAIDILKKIECQNIRVLAMIGVLQVKSPKIIEDLGVKN